MGRGGRHQGRRHRAGEIEWASEVDTGVFQAHTAYRGCSMNKGLKAHNHMDHWEKYKVIMKAWVYVPKVS